MVTDQLGTATIMLMLAARFTAMIAGRVNTSTVIGHTMESMRLAKWFVAMIAQDIIASGAFVLHMLTTFLSAMIAIGIFTSAIKGCIMGDMLAVFSPAMFAV